MLGNQTNNNTDIFLNPEKFWVTFVKIRNKVYVLNKEIYWNLFKRRIVPLNSITNTKEFKNVIHLHNTFQQLILLIMNFKFK